MVRIIPSRHPIVQQVYWILYLAGFLRRWFLTGIAAPTHGPFWSPALPSASEQVACHGGHTAGVPKRTSGAASGHHCRVTDGRLFVRLGYTWTLRRSRSSGRTS